MLVFKLLPAVLLCTCFFSLNFASAEVEENLDEFYARTPVGWVLKTCVHTVPSGSHLVQATEGNDGLYVYSREGQYIRTIPKCDTRNGTLPMIKAHREYTVSSRSLLQFPSDYEGWLAYTAFNYEAGLDVFLGNFNVPATPPYAPDVLYIFTGLQNIDWIPVVDPEPGTPFDIIQPVLQYPGDDGDYWSVKSWYVTLDVGTVASSEIPLAVGATIFGNMTRTGPQGWYIGAENLGTGQNTYVTVNNPRLASQPWAYNTIECYGCSGCSTYPQNSGLDFSKLYMTSQGAPITPQWKVDPKPSHLKQCKEKFTVKSPDHVTASFT